jgi:plastocyanin
MLKRLLIPLTVAAIALATVAGVNAKDRFDLKGQVYPNFKIEMKNSANRPLRTVKAGTYRIKIEDKSAIHNFRLTGPGVNKATTVPFIGERIWTVTLKRGKYVFVCDPHADEMRGSFRVT